MHTLNKRKLLTYSKIYCGVEQLVARRAHNPKVTGSSPVPATKKGQTRVWPFVIPPLAIPEIPYSILILPFFYQLTGMIDHH